MEPGQLAPAVFRSPSTSATIGRWRRMLLAAGHAPRPFYPRCSATRSRASPSRLRREDWSRRRSWGFTLRSFVPGRQVSERFRSSFPTCRQVGFHLDLFLSRDRPSDVCRRGRYRQRLGTAFHPHTHVKTADHGSPPRLLGLHPAHSPFPAIISMPAGRSCLGFCLFQVFRHHDECAHAASKIRTGRQPPENRFRLQSAPGLWTIAKRDAPATLVAACESLQSPTLQRFDGADA